VYDGTGAGVPAFAGPTYAQSPLLKGATNKEYPGTYHNDLRMSPAIIADYRAFLEQAEAPVLVPGSGAGPDNAAVLGRTTAAPAPSATGTLAATGGNKFVSIALVALGIGLGLAIALRFRDR
jgi:hypothetical protein